MATVMMTTKSKPSLNSKKKYMINNKDGKGDMLPSHFGANMDGT